VKRRPVSACRFPLWTTPIAAPAPAAVNLCLRYSFERLREDQARRSFLRSTRRVPQPHGPAIDRAEMASPCRKAFFAARFGEFELARATRIAAYLERAPSALPAETSGGPTPSP
jgi:hypothetical protein